MNQRRLWPVWFAIAFGTGVAVYFTMPAEPPIWLGAVACPIGVAACWLPRGRDPALAASTLLTAVAASFLAGEARTSQVEVRMLPAPLERALFVGAIDQIELLAG